MEVYHSSLLDFAKGNQYFLDSIVILTINRSLGLIMRLLLFLLMNRIILLTSNYLPRNKLTIFPKARLLMTSAPYYILAALTFVVLAMDRIYPWPFIAIAYSAFPLLD